MPESTKISTLIEESARMRLYAAFYRTDSGNEPVREWIKSFRRDDKAIIGKAISEVQWGWPLGMPLVRKMEKDLWEVRVNISDGRIARVLFTIFNEDMLLLHGFVKKTPKTPSGELDIARERRKQAERDHP